MDTFEKKKKKKQCRSNLYLYNHTKYDILFLRNSVFYHNKVHELLAVQPPSSSVVNHRTTLEEGGCTPESS